MVQGHCLCGQVAFTITGPLRPATLCHCGQCRRQAGHAWVATELADTALTFNTSETLSWYRASSIARRGFCQACGSFLFWKHDQEDTISVSAGALTPPTGLSLGEHIFTADKGDYYDINAIVPIRADMPDA